MSGERDDWLVRRWHPLTPTQSVVQRVLSWVVAVCLLGSMIAIAVNAMLGGRWSPIWLTASIFAFATAAGVVPGSGGLYRQPLVGLIGAALCLAFLVPTVATDAIGRGPMGTVGVILIVGGLALGALILLVQSAALLRRRAQ